MDSFANLIQESASNAWFFIPSAILLGALHGLEPGHSKTMMAAFIVAIRGTILQVILLAIAATISHTLIVWIVALIGLRYGGHWSAVTTEPYFQIASAVLIIGIACWVLIGTWRQHRPASLKEHHHHDHDHGHDHHHHHDHHEHTHSERAALKIDSLDYQDAHELAHANDIKRRFAKGNVTTEQIILFGLTGGLIPCSAAITVLLLCLQLKHFLLGVILVLCFSIGLALTLIASGIMAALSVHHISKRWSGLEKFTRYVPYFSGLIIVCIGLYVGYQGLTNL